MLLMPMSVLAQEPDIDPMTRATQDVQADDYVFLTWYNGWTRHDVWGVGAVRASYMNGSVECGDRTVKLEPIYDSHADRRPPGQNETKAYAKSYNLTVLELLQSNGVKCDFVLIDED